MPGEIRQTTHLPATAGAGYWGRTLGITMAGGPVFRDPAATTDSIMT